MKITLFSSNHPRHIHLAKKLSTVADKVYFVQECTTIHTGEVSDFYEKSDTMQRYFSQVIAAEKKIFGQISFPPTNVQSLALKMHDLKLVRPEQLDEALESDVYIVFGATYIRGWLVDFLVERQALNIHMGVSPYYRGSSCNFWALYDNNFGYVGATVHMLSKGLDSGAMLFHCLPKVCAGDTPFDFTMRAVLAAHNGLAENLRTGAIFDLEPVKQQKESEIRYTRNAQFTDGIALEFLQRNIVVGEVAFEYPELLQPHFQA